MSNQALAGDIQGAFQTFPHSEKIKEKKKKDINILLLSNVRGAAEAT